MVLNIRKPLEGARLALVLTMLSVLALGGCTTVPVNLEERKAYYETNDPIEPVNRAILSFNRGLDTIVLKPVASAYKNILPQILQDGIRNFLNNLRSPIILANNLLQGDIDGAQQVGGVGLDVCADGNLGPGDAQCEICGHGFLRFVTR